MDFRQWFVRPWILSLLVFLVAGLFYAWNLGGQYYQLDEAGTILQSEGIANLGYPSGWDGHTLISDNNGREYDLAHGSFFYTWQPPLQSYTAYLGGLVFGKTVFGYRLLFVLFGAGTVALFFHIASRLFPSRQIVYLVTLQLLMLLPFFLYVRQVRYYAPSAFFSMVFLYLLVKTWHEEWGRRETALLFCASTFLFLTNYFVWAGSVAFLGLVFLWQKKRSRLLTLSLTGILPVAWYLLVHPFAGDPAGAYHRDMNMLVQFSRYVAYIHHYLFLLFLVPLFFLRKQLPTMVFLLVLFILVKLVFYAVLLDAHGRYLVDLMPVFILLYGFLYTVLKTGKIRFLVPVLVLCVTLITNIGVLVSGMVVGNTPRLMTLPAAFRSELTGSYPTLLEPLSDTLKRSYRAGDIFWANNYRDSLTVRSGIPHFSPVCDETTGRPLGPEPVAERTHIRWFIFFQHDNRLVQELTTVPCLGKEWQRVLEEEYKRVAFTLPSGFYTINDPDIVNRQFPPIEAQADQVIVYEKKDKSRK